MYKKVFTTFMAVIFVVINLVCTINAAEPSIDHPCKYMYKADIKISNDFGYVLNHDANIGVSFYTSEKAYNNGVNPIASAGAEYIGNGVYEAQYTDTFAKAPPASLYWVATVYKGPSCNVNVGNSITTADPMSGIAYAQQIN